MSYEIRTLTSLAEIAAVISLDEAKGHLQIELDDTEDDHTIKACLASAQDHIERFTGHILTPREMELSVRGFPGVQQGFNPTHQEGAIVIPREPVTGVTAIDYLNSAGAAAALTERDWRWDESAPKLVRAAIGTPWPSAYDEAGSVRIRFEAGYDEGLAPSSLIGAVKLMLGSLYAQRENVITGTIVSVLPGGVKDLCDPYRRIAV